ncbi:hypothetical protein HHK36_024974 [Tetracentron sinense]|uniref:Methyltransferase type 11 domain-containing protein n=1 Tax=Tetracentron sinense TaxID=13715 RepID=A0A835D4R7_TETSI|nr:hypothetical protein HHK36_024974 [Tetracentron sinense]
MRYKRLLLVISLLSLLLDLNLFLVTAKMEDSTQPEEISVKLKRDNNNANSFNYRRYKSHGFRIEVERFFEFGAASNMETDGCILEWGKKGRLRVGFVLWEWGFGVAFVGENRIRRQGDWSRFLKGAIIGCFIPATLALEGLLQEHCVSIGKSSSSSMWVEGDALDLPFPDSYFDAITIGYGLRNVVDRPRAMQEMFRVLKPGSRVSILDFNKSTQPFVASIQEWMIDSVVVPVASSYGLAKEYEYLKFSIREFLTGLQGQIHFSRNLSSRPLASFVSTAMSMMQLKIVEQLLHFKAALGSLIWKELEKLALEVGFSNAKHYEIGGGLMGNLIATR